MNIKFISYDGKYPAACHGTLTLSKDNKIYSFEPHIDFHGDKDIIDMENLPKELKKYYKEIVKIIEDNIDFACCGGCL
jgi:hypothetical protein